MAIKTRSSTGSPVKAALVGKPPLILAKTQAPKLFILPQNASKLARFLLLKHPRDRLLTRFYFCPEKGLFEFTKVASPSTDLRSILFTPRDDCSDIKPEDCNAADHIVTNTQ